MGVVIHTIPLGFDNTYIVKDQGIIMIDGGEPKKSKAFIKGLEEASIRPEDIKLRGILGTSIGLLVDNCL